MKALTPFLKSTHAPILIAEDEPGALNFALNDLREAGLQVLNVEMELEAELFTRARRAAPSVAVLVMSKPDSKGLEICQKIKTDRRLASISVMVVDARGEEHGISAFEHGADTYISLPVSPREIMLHLRALLRYKPAAIAQRPVILASGSVEMDVARRLVTLDGTPLLLTRAEFRILAILVESRGKVQNRAALAQNLWGGAAHNLRALDAHVTRLRRKLGGYRGQLRTLRGLGYKWLAE